MQDWISLPLVGFPLISSLLLLVFVSRASESMRNKLSDPIRMACLVFSLVLLGITTGMFFQYFGDISWEGIGFNQYEYEHRYTWIESLGIHWTVGLDALSFPMVWLTNFLLPVTFFDSIRVANLSTCAR